MARLALVAALAASIICAQAAFAETNQVPVKLIKGECGQISPLEGMIRSNDSVKQFTQVSCVSAAFTPPPESKAGPNDKGNGEGLVALVDASGAKGLFVRGSWKDNDFNPVDVSFDQQSWYPVSKGRCRFYINDAEQSLMIVCFAVYKSAGSNKTQGVAVVFRQQ